MVAAHVIQRIRHLRGKRIEIHAAPVRIAHIRIAVIRRMQPRVRRSQNITQIVVTERRIHITAADALVVQFRNRRQIPALRMCRVRLTPRIRLRGRITLQPK